MSLPGLEISWGGRRPFTTMQRVILDGVDSPGDGENVLQRHLIPPSDGLLQRLLAVRR